LQNEYSHKNRLQNYLTNREVSQQDAITQSNHVMLLLFYTTRFSGTNRFYII